MSWRIKVRYREAEEGHCRVVGSFHPCACQIPIHRGSFYLFCSKGPTLLSYGPLYCKIHCISSAILFLLTFGHSSYREALQVSRYLNEQRQDEEEHSFHSHVCYDDPYARPLKRKNIVHKAKCTGWLITKPVE